MAIQQLIQQLKTDKKKFYDMHLLSFQWL